MDDEGVDEVADDDEEPRPGAAFSFDTESGSMPHWSEPPTGQIPVIAPEADEPARGGSRLFPQLPDDPNMVDEVDAPDDFAEPPTTGIELGGSLATGVDDLAPTGPIDSIVPQIPGDDLPSPRWAEPAEATPASGLDLPSPEFDDRLDELLGDDDLEDWGEPAGVFEFAADDPDVPIAPSTAAAEEASSTLEPGPVGDLVSDSAADEIAEVDDDIFAPETERFVALDDVPDIGSPEPVEPEPVVQADHHAETVPQVEPGPPAEPAPVVEDVPVVPLQRDVVEPGVALTESVPTPSASDDDELGAWSALDEQAPLWREGASDYQDPRSTPDAAERTVLHFEEPSDTDKPGPPPSGRNMPLAIGTAVALVGVFLFLVDRGPGWAMLLIVPLLVTAASEFFMSVRKVGYRPATLLGLVTVAGLSIGAYYEGLAAIPVVLMLSVIFGLLWYLFGVEFDRPTANLSVTLLGIMWVGLLGAHVPLILELPNGSGILFGAIIGTATYDTAGLFIGRATGQSRLAPSISPNKTYEGLIGGMIFAVLVVTFGLGVAPGLAPWDGNQVDALLLGIVVAVLAPLGDLAQSLIKRDLGVKDMGTALPGHGGVFDRFDAMLFVLPAVYYLALARDLDMLV